MNFKKSAEEKEQKQLEMEKLESKYRKFLQQKVSAKIQKLKTTLPDAKILFEDWIYGIYVAILDVQEPSAKRGRLFYSFENIPEAENKYKLSYEIDENNNCIFDLSKLKLLPKSYLSLLKKHHFNLINEKSSVKELICAHLYNIDNEVYIHHCDYNPLNNSIKNLVPIEKQKWHELSEVHQKNLKNAAKLINPAHKINFKKKTKDIIKMEYRACDLYYNHRISPEKIASTLRNRLKRADIIRTVKLYKYFKEYNQTSSVEIN